MAAGGSFARIEDVGLKLGFAFLNLAVHRGRCEEFALIGCNRNTADSQESQECGDEDLPCHPRSLAEREDFSGRGAFVR